MAIALSDISLPVFIQMLGGLDGLVDKAAAYCADRKVDPDALLHARLAPSMYDFARQIRAICDWPVLAICHTTGAKAPEFAAGDKTFADLKARIATTIAFVQSADRAAFDAAEARELDVSIGANKRFMHGKDYIAHRVLPQFYFHVTAAYSILRHSGLELSKSDYMGKVPGQRIP